MTPDEIARVKAREVLLQDSYIRSLISESCLDTLYVLYAAVMPTCRRGYIFGHELAPGLYLAEEVYDEYVAYYRDTDPNDDGQEEVTEYYLVVTDPAKLGIPLEDLDEYNRNKFVKATPAG